MKRRWFLGGALGLALWPSFSFVHGTASAGVGRETIPLADRLLEACPKRSSAVVVGKAYLEELSSLPNIGQLIEDLICNLGTTSSELSTIAPVELRARHRVRTSEDFGAGRTVQLHGWILGEAEAKLCALAALYLDRKNRIRLTS